MHVSLTPELEAIVQDKVKSGYYSNASEVVRDAIRRLHERELASYNLTKVLNLGLEDIESGQTVPYDMQAIREKAKSDQKLNLPISSDVKD